MTNFKSLSQSNAISGAETCLRLIFDCVYCVFVNFSSNLINETLVAEYSKSHASRPRKENMKRIGDSDVGDIFMLVTL